jgi:hypothetical protein
VAPERVRQVTSTTANERWEQKLQAPHLVWSRVFELLDIKPDWKK